MSKKAKTDKMKKILFAMAVAATLLSACDKPVERPSWFTNETYFEEKNGMYEEISVCPGNIVMVGDDYVDRGLWNEFFGDTTFKNRGITYDATEHVLYRIDKIAAGKPYKIFVSVGYNDVLHGTPADEIVANIEAIFKRIHKRSPNTKCYWMNIVGIPGMTAEQSATIGTVNEKVADGAKAGDFEVVDIKEALYEGLSNGTFTWDGGKFLNGAGYAALTKALEPYVDRTSRLAPNDQEDTLEVSDYYKHRLSMFRAIPATGGQIVMLGNSLINNGLWTELFPLGYVMNRGISGDVVAGVDQRVPEVARHKPAKLYMVTGTNDFINNPEISAIEVWQKYEKLIKDIREQMPQTAVHVFSTLPLNPKTKYYEGFNERAAELNKLLQSAAGRYGYAFIDITKILSDENGDLCAEYTTDGIHLNVIGYYLWAGELAKANRMLRDL